jgi:drug/metabolite transporter (DMT)-like permease
MSTPAPHSVGAPAAAPASRLPAILALLANAFVWGLSWWPLRRLQEMGLHPLWATTLFFVLGCVLVLLWRRGAWPALRAAPSLAVLAVATGATNAAFNWGVATGEVVRVVLLFYLMPLWAVFLARWLLGEPLTRAGLLRVGLGLAGAVLVLSPPGGGIALRLHGLADVLGLVGGLCFALTNVWLRREAARPAEARALAMFIGGALLPAALGLLLAGQDVLPWLPPPAPGWVALALAQGVVFIAANLALQYGAARVSVAVASVVMLTEVVFAAASAVWIGGETLHPSLGLGGALIMGSALLAALERQRAG